MTTTITNHGFDSQYSLYSTATTFSSYSFFLDEGINRIKLQYLQSTESSNWLYLRVYKVTNSTAVENRMRISYNTRLLSGSSAADYGNNSGNSSTNELMWLNYFTSDSSTSQIPHQIDLTVLSVPCTSKISPYIWYEGTYGNTGGNGTYSIFGGGKIMRRVTDSERPLRLVVWSNSGATLAVSGSQRHTEGSVRLGA